jgi:hypothetical protein
MRAEIDQDIAVTDFEVALYETAEVMRVVNTVVTHFNPDVALSLIDRAALGKSGLTIARALMHRPP